MIKIEEGKFYNTRDGQKIGPMHLEYGYSTHPWSGDDNGVPRSYMSDGHWSMTGCAAPYFRDLVAEWREPTDEDAVIAAEGIRPGDDDWYSTHLADGSPTEATAEIEDFETAMVEGAREPDIKTEIADEAKRIVSGARRSAYGKPEQNFERISRYWSAYMANTGRDVTITPADVSPLMVLMKLARLAETPKHKDSMVDAVGYVLTMAEVNGVQPKDA